MRKKNIISLLLGVVIICTLLVGCGESAVIKIGDKEFLEETYLAAIAYINASIEQQSGINLSENLDETFMDQKGIDILKEQAEDSLKYFEAIKKLAKDNGVSLSAEDRKKLEESKKEQIESYGGRKMFLEELEVQGMNEEFVDYSAEVQMLYEKYVQTFAVSAEEFAEAAEFGKYVRVKHVLVMATPTDADFAEKKALAEEISARASSGEDFDALVKEYGEDPGMETYTHGYIITQDGYTTDGQTQMMQEFTDASIALEIGEVSAPVQSSYGFHIIKRYSLEAADFENEELMREEFMSVALAARVIEAEEEVKVTRLEGFDEVDIRGFFKDLEKKQSSVSHEGHNH